MTISYLLGAAFTIWMAVEAVRRNQTMPWLWIIIFLPPIGGAAYFFIEYLPTMRVATPRLGGASKASAADERRAAAEVKRLDNTDAWTEYARVLRERKKTGEAIEAATRAVERDDSNHHAHYELGRSLLLAGRSVEAAPHFERPLAVDPKYDLGAAKFSLARAYLQSGRPQRAREHLEELAATSSRPEFLHELATVQQQLGDREAARATLERIVDEAEFVPNYARASVRPWVRKARRGLAQLGA